MDEYLKQDRKVELTDEGPSEKPFVLSISLPPQYEIVEELGQGGMGTVYKARHKQLGNFVAIKVINPSLLEGKNETRENAQKRFVNEARAVSQLKHENLIALKDFGVTPEGAAFMVMDFVEGKTLDALIEMGPMDYKQVLQLMRGICDGLEEAHSLGLVHRDIKSGNIIVARSVTGREIPKLLDFGIARITGDDGKTGGLTGTGEVFGSPNYIAPEQSLSSKVDRRADIYSLGCVLFECVTGKLPFKGDTAMHTVMMHLNSPIPSASSVLGKPLPPDLEYIIARCLQKEPAKRYPTAMALKADIDLLLAGKKLKRGSVSGSPGGAKNTRAFMVLGASAVAIACAGLIAVASLSPPGGPPGGTSGGQTGGQAGGQPPNKLPPGNLEDDAYNADVGESFAAFQRGDYNKCIILQKGAIGVYDDGLEAVAKEIAKGATGPNLAKLRDRENRLQFLKAENLKHVGDCYRLMGQNDQAISYYAKAHDIFARWAFTGYRSKDMDESYKFAIDLLRKAGRTGEAEKLQQEFERSLHSGPRR